MIFATLFIFSLVFVEKRLIRVLWLVGISVPFAVGLYVFALGLERPDIGALYYLVLALWEVGFALWPAKPAKMAG